MSKSNVKTVQRKTYLTGIGGPVGGFRITLHRLRERCEPSFSVPSSLSREFPLSPSPPDRWRDDLGADLIETDSLSGDYLMAGFDDASSQTGDHESNESPPLLREMDEGLFDEPEYLTILEEAARNLPEAYREILQARDRQERDKVIWAIHNFKGVTGQYGMERLCRRVTDLYAVLERGEWPENFSEQLEEIGRIMLDTIDEIERLTESDG